MAKVELKTKATNVSVDRFLESISNVLQREDSKIIIKIMQKIIMDKPKMWGTSIIGFGKEYLKYESGRELDWFKIGFSPRKNAIAIYGIKSASSYNIKLFPKLGSFSRAKSCIYIKQLSDINLKILEEMIQESVL